MYRAVWQGLGLRAAGVSIPLQGAGVRRGWSTLAIWWDGGAQGLPDPCTCWGPQGLADSCKSLGLGAARAGQLRGCIKQAAWGLFGNCLGYVSRLVGDWLAVWVQFEDTRAAVAEEGH